MSVAAAGALALAAALDRTFSEPPAGLHPVAWLGRGVAGLDGRLPDSRSVGVALAFVAPLAFAALLATPVVVVGSRVPASAVPAAATAGVVLFVCSSRRMLVAVARDVIDLADGDLETARHELRALAGRDAGDLSPAHVRSAAVESAAENLADGLIAPLSAFVLTATVAPIAGLSTTGGLAFAAGATAWVKGVNTLDSMLGYRDRRAGWAPARLDDGVMWLPARATALLILVAGWGATATGPLAGLGRTRSAALVPDSPNAGWPMGSLAAVLDVRLTKPGAYTLLPGSALPTTPEARRGVRIVSRAGWLGLGVAGVSLAL
ncbi:CobD/CbiB family cobalamin biosynthesis protein [Halorubrum sp. 48-1-W]|uniref:CobD/CbiB family cobalamin biosynthesis protein n=1 Tax=Halorubrum sp. 48-1-W TaxID=2249761 RepID=UPI000DCCFFC2|nr:CobD/CbiB family cobalamin biosynthesis protein [Halorubrum sp. 48-1-W]RAW44931.1 CobD/CbiB family cobalamin biosynthesis protein [Halorubrum sp. 48-1-W]